MRLWWKMILPHHQQKSQRKHIQARGEHAYALYMVYGYMCVVTLISDHSSTYLILILKQAAPHQIPPSKGYGSTKLLDTSVVM